MKNRGYGQNSGGSNGYAHPILQKRDALQLQIAQIQAANAVKEQQLNTRANALRQGTVPVNGPQDVLTNLKNCLPDYLVPGNLGDVNRVIWPFWFTNITPELPAAEDGAQTQVTASVTITQEAAFIVTSYSKAIFEHTTEEGDEIYSYIDPAQAGQDGLTPGLSMTIEDAQSTRVFMSNPIDFDTIGDSQFPQDLPTPLMFLPNSVIKTQLFNTSDKAYVAFVTFLGVRCRIEDAQRIMSLITG